MSIEESIIFKAKEKIRDTLTKIFRSELLNYKILPIPFRNIHMV